jgi:plastocyanin
MTLKRAATLLAVLVLAGCGSSSRSSTGASGSVSQPTGSSTTTATSTTTGAAQSSGLAAGGTIHVTMKNLAFKPAAINVKVGDRVVFTNDDAPPHNVTWVSGPKFTSSSTLNTGAKFTLTVSQPGTIHYFCSIHPFMKGSILVTK